MPEFIDETGNRYGLLTALRYVPGGSKKKWECICDCGNVVLVDGSRLRNGKVASCGCAAHGAGVDTRTRIVTNKSNTRLYRIWHSMTNRCRNRNNWSYKWYGGKGVTVCQEWKSFVAFEKWALNNGYDETLTIERIDVSKGYSPDNCRWATWREQTINKRSSNRITYNGETMTVAEWADRLGCSRYTLYGRKARGWTDEETIGTGTDKRYRIHGKVLNRDEKTKTYKG